MANLRHISHQIMRIANAEFEKIHAIIMGNDEERDGDRSRATTDYVANQLGVDTKPAYKKLKAAEKAGYVLSMKDVFRKNVQNEDVNQGGVGWAYWEAYLEDGEVKNLLHSNAIKDTRDKVMAALLALGGTKKAKNKFEVELGKGQIQWTVDVYDSQGAITVILSPKAKGLNDKKEVIQFHVSRANLRETTKNPTWLEDLVGRYSVCMERIRR